MRLTRYLACAAFAASALAGGAASAANICQTSKLTCPTTMPTGGYCECTAHGATEDGTVVSEVAPPRALSANSGWCGAHPADPGCR